MHFEPYLHFEGTCEEALRFYAEIFGGNVTDLTRFGDAPMAKDLPPGNEQRVMHATFRSPSVNLMASDTFPDETLPPAGRVRLSVADADVEACRKLFERLSTGGTILMPFEKQFWGASFGMLTDKYGIQWMANGGG